MDPNSRILFCQSQVSKYFNLFSLCSPQKEVSLCEMINHNPPYSLRCVGGFLVVDGSMWDKFLFCFVMSEKWKMRPWEREHHRWRKIESPGKFPKAFSFRFSFFFEWEIIHVHWSEVWFKPEFKLSLGFPGVAVEKRRKLMNSLFWHFFC